MTEAKEYSTPATITTLESCQHSNTPKSSAGNQPLSSISINRTQNAYHSGEIYNPTGRTRQNNHPSSRPSYTAPIAQNIRAVGAVGNKTSRSFLHRDTVKLSDEPVVTLELGSNLNLSAIREGIDVYFECNIKSNPWVYKVSWRHNGNPLYHNPATGTIISNQSLVLQSVTRGRAGIYTCIGSNQEGDGESNPLNLDIKSGLETPDYACNGCTRDAIDARKPNDGRSIARDMDSGITGVNNDWLRRRSNGISIAESSLDFPNRDLENIGTEKETGSRKYLGFLKVSEIQKVSGNLENGKDSQKYPRSRLEPRDAAAHL
ncbi:B-cell receptor CD22 [Eufriesea mexicana]|uniref:B-cell receptor CD22 n=1 Tax=Eufriesea mexicana TaxID=516756 RepID=A0A310SQ60_9HYME|nr:B-cell receptor CD22 [Eufriesea mexicana]